MTDDLAAAARKLVDAVTFDMCGVNGKGGNGGLLSNETLRAADECRAILNRTRKTGAKGNV